MTADWSGWCDGSAHEPWHVFQAETNDDRIYRAVARTADEARAKIKPHHRGAARLYVTDYGPARCWRYKGHPDPHAFLHPDEPPQGEREGRMDR